jgi:hypothetical protein
VTLGKYDNGVAAHISIDSDCGHRPEKSDQRKGYFGVNQ